MTVIHGAPAPLPAPPSDADPAAAAPPRCLVTDCTMSGWLLCAYVDRDGARCTTRWCRQHVSVQAGRGYCRRHAGTVAALPPGTPIRGTLPPVDNRALSLLGWVAATLDPLIRRVLAHEAPSRPILNEGPEIVVDAGRHRWVRSWTVADTPPGSPLAVAVEVDEDDDTLLRIRVAGGELGCFTPPWIEPPGPLDSEADLAARRDFYTLIVTMIHEELQAALRPGA